MQVRLDPDIKKLVKREARKRRWKAVRVVNHILLRHYQGYDIYSMEKLSHLTRKGRSRD